MGAIYAAENSIPGEEEGVGWISLPQLQSLLGQWKLMGQLWSKVQTLWHYGLSLPSETTGQAWFR